MTDRNNNPSNAYTIKWKDKKNPDTEHFVAVFGYGAKLFADVLKESGYQFSVYQDGVQVPF